MSKTNFKYKKNINGQMGFGYGSKYQLLRMLGWHRNDFNKAIASTACVDENINWLDFDFNGPEDKELLNFDFIKDLKKEWRNYWACGKGQTGLNWDAVGIASNGTIILVEAKANLDELLKTSPAGGCKESLDNNNKVISNILSKHRIMRTVDDWGVKCYQLANRLVALDFLLSKGYKAELVYVLFENGFEYNCPENKSVSAKEWIEAFGEELAKSGVEGTELGGHVHACIIDCNNKKY